MSDQRYSKNLAIQGVLESGYGVQATTFNANDVVLLSEEPTHEMAWLNVDRNNVRNFFGVSEQLPATHYVKTKFATEVVASGVAGTPPPIARWLIACGLKETIFAGNRVEYDPSSQDAGSISMRFVNDGVRYSSKGGRGKVNFKFNAMGLPIAEFEIWSLARAETVQAMPATDYTNFKFPEAITDANTGDIRFGTTLAAGVVTGGTSYKSLGMTLSYANSLEHFPMLGGEDVTISDRKVTGNMTVALDEATEVQWFTDVRNIATTTMSFRHGSVAGKQILLHGRRVQRYNLNRAPQKGRLLFDVDLGFVPEGSDNEVKLIFK